MALDAVLPDWHEASRLITGSNASQKKMLVLIAAPVFLVCVAVYRLYFHPLAHIPGPFLARLTGLWRTQKYAQGKWHETILDVHRTYGRVVRIAPNEVAVVDESAMKNLYGHGHNAPKTSWYSVWDPPDGTPQLFSELDKPRHSFLRRRLAGAYAMSSVLKYEVYIQDCLDVLMDKLRNKAQAGEVVDMSNWTTAFAYDVIGELGFGSQFGHMKEERDIGHVRSTLFTIFTIAATVGHLPGQMALVINPLSSLVQKLVGAKSPMISFISHVEDVVQDRLNHLDSVDRDDILGHFCRMKDVSGKNPAHFREMAVEAQNLLGAGADTTAIAMRACLFFLSTSPAAYKLLQEEVDAFYTQHQLDQSISYLECQKLPYLQAVVKEATRLLPSVVFQLIRYAPPNFAVRGMTIPENTEVGISPLAQNRDKDIWGPDADEFRPERWTESVEKAKYYDTSSMVFGGNGPRMCVGRNIALVEMQKFLAEFIRHFDFEMVDKMRPWNISSFWFAYQHDFLFRIKERNLDSTKGGAGLA